MLALVSHRIHRASAEFKDNLPQFQLRKESPDPRKLHADVCYAEARWACGHGLKAIDANMAWVEEMGLKLSRSW